MTGVSNLGDEENLVYVKAMLGYIYEVNISEVFLDHDISPCVKLFKLGDKYDVPDLRNDIYSLLENSVWPYRKKDLGTKDFREMIGAAFFFPAADKRVQDYLVEMCAPFGVLLSKDKAFMEAVRDLPKLGARLLETMFNKVEKVETVFQCSTCEKRCIFTGITGGSFPNHIKARCGHTSVWKRLSIVHTLNHKD